MKYILLDTGWLWNNQSIVNATVEIIKSILPLVGVVLGLYIAPMIANRKRKWEIKSELFQTIFLYYNAKKCYLHKTNYQMFHDQRRSIVAKKLREDEGGKEARAELLRQHDVCKGWADRHHAEAWHWYTEMINLDGRVSLLLVQCPYYFKKTRKRDVRADIEKHLYRDKVTSLLDYGDMDEKHLDKAWPKIEPVLSEKYKEIDESRGKAIKLLESVLS